MKSDSDVSQGPEDVFANIFTAQTPSQGQPW